MNLPLAQLDVRCWPGCFLNDHGERFIIPALFFLFPFSFCSCSWDWHSMLLPWNPWCSHSDTQAEHHYTGRVSLMLTLWHTQTRTCLLVRFTPTHSPYIHTQIHTHSYTHTHAHTVMPTLVCGMVRWRAARGKEGSASPPLRVTTVGSTHAKTPTCSAPAAVSVLLSVGRGLWKIQVNRLLQAQCLLSVQVFDSDASVP
jgi:hypothetical protein